jgi:hypothetical protein
MGICNNCSFCQCQVIAIKGLHACRGPLSDGGGVTCNTDTLTRLGRNSFISLGLKSSVSQASLSQLAQKTLPRVMQRFS